ncbi:MAG TPA: endopeptidase La [Syntrophorhabdus sp.]|jgi:ATP-dependent Lon protease|nr:endopeptidase La [Syntrophorhabdus sp.]MDI9557232.1 endopeptidase La [Pseudomonadota bacterium]OPX98360.1 MAG: Lon protease 2 [Syntrophorhabdus sp. PtaB.Bin027]OQB76885.1 MAG: Lon protease 2 [Deltaproteobacteria bacterium ADurb.Bin135]MBP8743545.1 endopeptidase La [Syntrophorhabdus sp.]
MVIGFRNDKTLKDKIFIPAELPILPLRGTVAYPDLVMPLIVGRDRSIKLVDEANAGDKMIGIITQKNPDIEDPGIDDLYMIGTVATIMKMVKMVDGSQRIVVQGICRFKLVEFTSTEPHLRAKILPIFEEYQKDIEIDAMYLNLKNLYKKAVEMAPYLSSELSQIASQMENPGNLVDLIGSTINIGVAEKQEILEKIDLKERLKKVTILLNREVETLELSSRIQSHVKEGIDKTQREYYLREQLKAIQKELGETDDKMSEMEEIRKKILEARMPPDVQKIAEKELDRLSKMSNMSAEYTVSRTYLDWLTEIPWSQATEDNLNIQDASKILDEDHYDLTKVKKRILEYLAVRKLKADMKGPILCFAGPPGVGKTSLGKSIARALGRKFMRISLGGIRDEAEIRGHRRTYVGALPGRIIQGVKKAGSNNPVFMLDEVDKIGMDFRGDPSSALLEVLDPEQNFSFSDHYLEVPFDLSKVMFIATANMLDPIPPALKDRMEVLELPGYTEEEKLMIAKQFLIPKERNEHGLTEDLIEFQDDALKVVIKSYTKESGVRNLEREIATICRAVARDVAEGTTEKKIITADSIHGYLGPIKFFSEVAERVKYSGVATGLAWTPTGGDILFIESTKMRGKGNLTLTGQLGDVMKESAQAALSYIRGKAADFNITEDFFEKNDLHVHVPQGAIPKDGPSAGVTMLVSLVSLLTDRHVRNDVAMTGEITLRGLVLPVGGIKEKVLAAKRAGIKSVILPKLNEKDLEEVPESIKENMEFKFIERMDEAVSICLTA